MGVCVKRYSRGDDVGASTTRGQLAGSSVTGVADDATEETRWPVVSVAAQPEVTVTQICSAPRMFGTSLSAFALIIMSCVYLVGGCLCYYMGVTHHQQSLLAASITWA
eukprot:7351587-Pyramimonas_sp.AAC.1